MNSLNTEKIQELIQQLEKSTRRSGANAMVRIDPHDSKKCVIKGDEQGLQRLGLELIKASQAPYIQSEPECQKKKVDCNISYLFENNIKPTPSIERHDPWPYSSASSGFGSFFAFFLALVCTAVFVIIIIAVAKQNN